MTTEEVLSHLRRRLPGFHPSGAPQSLSGGYLNFLWRVRGEPAPVIVKLAPPFIASIPDVALDRNRTMIEARAMLALGPGGFLADLATEDIRPPRLLDFDEEGNILIMEDASSSSDLGAWLREPNGGESEAAQAGSTLGLFIGALHARTFGDVRSAAQFDNAAIQRVRLEVHYKSITACCTKAGLPDAEALGRTAVAVGEALQRPGDCLTMGDLWPASIIMAPSGMRVIDWELAHFGQPFQDVAHFAAHLWMHAHRAPRPEAAARSRACLKGFLAAYGATMADRPRRSWNEMLRLCAVHFGCEILARTVGRFQDGYLYEGLAPDDPIVREAVFVAAEHLRSPDRVRTFADVRSVTHSS